MNNLNNLPPLYIGQKVVYITGYNMPKDSIHIVKDVFKIKCCNTWIISITTPFIIGKGYHLCSCCNTELSSDFILNIPKNQSFSASSFRAIESQSFPLLTYSKVLEEVAVSAN